MRNDRVDNRIRQITSLVASLMIIVAIVLPLVPLVIWSFARGWYFPHLIPQAWSLRAWGYVFSRASQVGRGVLQGAVVAVSVTLLSLLVGVPAGRALGLHRFRGKKLIQFLVLAPTLVPGIAAVMGIHVLFIKLRLTGTLLGVILVHLIPTTPYVAMVMTGVFANYNPDFEQQARSLGATPWQTFRRVTLPAIAPGILVSGMFAFIISWEQYLLTLMVGSGQVVTLPVLLFSSAGGSNHAVTAALALLLIAPSLLVLAFTARHLTGESAAMGGIR